MPSLFASYRATAAASIDRVFGEPVRISPRVALPKRPLADDPDRPAVEIVARFRLKAETVPLEGERRGTELASFVKLTGADAGLSISPLEHPKIGFALRDGDLVTLLSPASGVWPRWSVLGQKPHAGGSMLVSLTREPLT